MDEIRLLKGLKMIRNIGEKKKKRNAANNGMNTYKVATTYRWYNTVRGVYLGCTGRNTNDSKYLGDIKA